MAVLSLNYWFAYTVITISIFSLVTATTPPAPHKSPSPSPSQAKCDKTLSKIYTKFCAAHDRNHNSTMVYQSWIVDGNGDRVDHSIPHYSNSTQAIKSSRFLRPRTQVITSLNATSFKLDFKPAVKTKVVKKCEMTCEQAYNYVAELECKKAYEPKHTVDRTVRIDVGCGEYGYRVLENKKHSKGNSTSHYQFLK